MGRKELSDLVFVMKLGGIWFNFNEGIDLNKIFTIFRSLYVVSATCLVGYNCMALGLKKSMTSIAVFFPLGVLHSVQMVMFYNQRTNMKTLMEHLSLIMNHEEEWEENLFQKDYRFHLKLIKFCFISYATFFAAYAFLPTIVDLFLYALTSNSLPPNLLHGFSNYVDENAKRSFSFYLILTLAQIFSACGIFGNFGVQASLFISGVYTRFEINIISQKIATLNIRGQILDEKYNISLRKIVDDYSLILCVIKDLQGIFGPIFVFQNSMTSVCSCMALYVATETRDVVQLLVWSSCLIMLQTVTFVANLVGERIRTENDNIFKAIYNINWYEQSPYKRKAINMLIRQTQRPLEISYKNIKPLGFANYMRVINSTYTYFMLLKSLD